MHLMDKTALAKDLCNISSPANMLTEPRDLFSYSYDATGKSLLPDAVVFANSTSEVSEIMRLAYHKQIPVVARGAGTNLSGGTIPSQGGIILELSRLNHILKIDITQQRAIVQPGVINLDLQNALRPLGFMYAPDPASQKTSTLGGNIGEDAGGPHCLRYGVTHNHVFAMEVVLADGQIIEIGAQTNDSLGYDLAGLIVGSEGTLGIITRITLRIMPIPETFQTMLVIFETLDDAFQCASDVISSGIIPGALELLDAPVIKAIEDTVHAGYPRDAEAVLLIELDILQDMKERQTRQIADICNRAHARELRVAQSLEERDAIWSGRRGAFGAVASVRPAYSCHDATVPRNKLVSMLHQVAKIADEYHLLIGHVAHAGDGNFHPLIMYDNKDLEESQRVEKAGKKILAAGVALGGTITGEHGVGLEKQDSLPLMFNHSELTLMHQIKDVFDPVGILNPGKILPSNNKIKEKYKSRLLIKPDSNKSKGYYNELINILGTQKIISDENEIKGYMLDDRIPPLVVFPDTVEEIHQVTNIASKYDLPIIPWGNGSKQNHGLPVVKLGIVLCLKRMNHLLDLDADNLTAEVETGIGYRSLQKELAKNNLYFPLNPEDAELATIGGIIASNSSGPSRLQHGTARDLVLGVTALTPSGNIIRAGIKTMKNVAGYDLRKLFIGSWGTLGVTTKAILKLYHLPESHSTLLLTFPDIANALQVSEIISKSALQPECMEIIDSRIAQRINGSDPFNLCEKEILLLVRTSGNNEEVKRTISDIQELAQKNCAQGVDILTELEEENVWISQREIHQYALSDLIKGKAVVPIDKIIAIFQEIEKVVDKHHIHIGITCRAGSGIIYPHLFATESSSSCENTMSAITKLSHTVEEMGGFFQIIKGPLQIRKSFDPLLKRSDYELMLTLKKKLDPQNIFNPGKLSRIL